MTPVVTVMTVTMRASGDAEADRPWDWVRR
jgi:hypothetical protein